PWSRVTRASSSSTHPASMPGNRRSSRGSWPSTHPASSRWSSPVSTGARRPPPPRTDPGPRFTPRVSDAKTESHSGTIRPSKWAADRARSGAARQSAREGSVRVRAAVDVAERPSGGGGMIGEYFKFAERGTDLWREVRGGLTTFMVMVYIVAVNPSILAAAGIDQGAAAAGTTLIAGILTIAMGVAANYPFAMAAGLGINGIVAFTLVLTNHLTPAGAMGVIVLEGIAVTVLVLVGVRGARTHTS